QTFVCNGWQRPEGFCESAWETLSPFVLALAHGGGNFYDGWMKNPKSAMLSCNDGFRSEELLRGSRPGSHRRSGRRSYRDVLLLRIQM
ncbi:MAG: TIGR04076 family protein, partial [Clostridia bacterium]|nr:TIGR04076 family protein [Clostridia bacterium]